MKILAVIFGVVLLASTTYRVIHDQITRDVRAMASSDHPELEWLRREYALSDGQFSRVKDLHVAHDVRCQEICRELATAQKRLKDAIESGDAGSAAFESVLQEWREQRERSQDSILRHMTEVCEILDDPQADRYREHIFQNLILPGRTPHIDDEGQFHSKFIRHSSKP